MIKGRLQLTDHNIVYDYDDFQDMLYILFIPEHPAQSYYVDLAEHQGVMFRYDKNDQIIGITAHFVEKRLGTASPSEENIRELTLDLIRQTHLERVLEAVGDE